MNNIEWLFFDMGYTLVNEDEAHRTRIQSAGTLQRLTAYGLIRHIDLVFSSTEEGISKPDISFYERALKAANCSAQEAVMIGDRLDNDIFPAKKLGMKTVWIKQGFGGLQVPQSEEYEPDHIIHQDRLHAMAPPVLRRRLVHDFIEYAAEVKAILVTALLSNDIQRPVRLRQQSASPVHPHRSDILNRSCPECSLEAAGELHRRQSQFAGDLLDRSSSP